MANQAPGNSVLDGAAASWAPGHQGERAMRLRHHRISTLTRCDDRRGRSRHMLERRRAADRRRRARTGAAGQRRRLPYLDDAELKPSSARRSRQRQERVPVLAGVSAWARRAPRAMRAMPARRRGGPCRCCRAPVGLTEAEILAYYREVCPDGFHSGDGLQQSLHHGHRPAGSVLASLAELPNVTMIKESSPDPSKIARLREACGDRAAVYIGLNCMARTGVADGAAGWCTASLNDQPAIRAESVPLRGDRRCPARMTGSAGRSTC